MTELKLPPACPTCTGQTTLKELRRLANRDAMMAFFRCGPCALEYPIALVAAEVARIAAK